MPKDFKDKKYIPAPEETQRTLGVEWQKPESTDATHGYVPVGKSIDEENIKR